MEILSSEFEIAYSNGTWIISHVSQSGRRYERSSQYRINDASAPSFYSWRGQLIGYPHLAMIGDLKGDVKAPIYSKNDSMISIKTGLKFFRLRFRAVLLACPQRQPCLPLHKEPLNAKQYQTPHKG